MTWRQHDLNDQPHAVYRIYDTADNLLYVGVSVDFETRLKAHMNRAEWAADYARHELTWYPNRPEAESAEVAAIMAGQPRYNVAGNYQVGRRPRPGKPIRITVDLDPQRYQVLREHVGIVGVGGSAAQVIRCLIDELQADPDLAARIRARSWAPKT